MCTLILAVQPSAEWKLVLAATRDEERTRGWDRPGRWWPRDHPNVIGGRDHREGGTWLAVDLERRRVAALVNRREIDGAPASPASRGGLPLAVLAAGAEDLDERFLREHNPFNLLDASSERTLCWRWDGQELGRVEVSAGIHMLTAGGLDDLAEPRQERWLSTVGAVAVPEPSTEPDAPPAAGWAPWVDLLEDPDSPSGDPGALNVRSHPEFPGWGTVSCSLVAFGEQAVRYDFCAGPPDSGAWERVI